MIRRNLATILSVARRLITFTAVLAALVCVVFSHWLSILTFGDPSMQWQFMLLGIAVGLSVAYTGHLSVLQGFHDVKNISRASLVGSDGVGSRSAAILSLRHTRHSARHDNIGSHTVYLLPSCAYPTSIFNGEGAVQLEPPPPHNKASAIDGDAADVE